jgi:hypothetical protein
MPIPGPQCHLGARDAPIQQRTSRHCEEPATRQSSSAHPVIARSLRRGNPAAHIPSLRGACDVAIQQRTSRHCEEPATRQSSYSARKGTADSFTAATGLPRFARNDQHPVIARSLRRGNPAAAPAKALPTASPQPLDCHASLAMTGRGRAITGMARNDQYPSLRGACDAAIQQQRPQRHCRQLHRSHWIATLRSQ